MSMFWLGYLAAIGTYLIVGFTVGVVLVYQHLAYFFAAGWKVRSMLVSISLNTILWPVTILDLYGD